VRRSDVRATDGTVPLASSAHPSRGTPRHDASTRDGLRHHDGNGQAG
jgi:hypothetical protein